jgi:glycosyltransferase involved in cell wall biosynthesis
VIRITHVITGLDQGGAEAALARVVLGLEGKGFRQSVISLTTRGVYGGLIEQAQIPLQTLGMTGVAAMIGGLPRLVRALNGLQPDIVQTWLYHADLLGLLAARFDGSAAVAWNVRCAALEPGDVSRSTSWLLRLLALLSAWPDAILFNSAAGLEAHGVIAYRPRRSLVIPNGFDIDEWRPDSKRRATFRTEIGAADDTFVIGMVARYHRMKDHRCFLAAAAKILSVRTDARFVLSGTDIDWSNDELVADIDRLGLRGDVALLGSRGDISTVMAGLDCLVLTSTSEGFPNVIGEAMAAGVPCVATDAGDAQLIMGDTGTVVDIGDYAAVAKGVLKLMAASGEQREALSARCRARIAEHFEIRGVVDRYAEFYRGINEERNQRQPRK